MTRQEYLRLYHSYGWTLVPVVKGEKRPAVNWKEYQERKPTNDELREWFKDPETGVGLVTGKCSGVIVIDEDSYKKASENNLTLDTPLKVMTGGGGKHYYFKYKDGVTNSVDHSRAIDVRGEGGFVVLPPTVHPNGKNYFWETPPPDTLDYLPTLDESFAEQYVKNKGQFSDPVKISDYMNISEGSRDDSLHRVACSILNKVPREEAILMINAVNNTYTPPLENRDVDRIIKSAIMFVERNPKQPRPDPGQAEKKKLDILSFSEAKTRYDELMAKYGEGVSTGYGLLDQYFKFVPQQLYMISAPTHVGKTTLVLNIAGRAARGGAKVILASLEQGVFVIPRIISMFGGDQGMENLSLVAPVEMPRVDDFIELFKDESTRPKLLIVDHLHYFERGDRGATEEMDKLVVSLQMLANKLEIPIVVIAHVRKLKDDKPPTMEDLKDSSSLSQIPAVVAMMHREKNDDVTAKSGGGMFSNQGTLFIYKNRIFGKTGTEDFKLFENGEIVFDREPGGNINQNSGFVGLDGFFDGKL